MGHVYDQAFYDDIEGGSRQSARVFISLLKDQLGLNSVLDVGCGRGAWLAEWQASGIADLAGLDGAYVDSANLAFSAGEFHPADLEAPFDLGRRFDMVQCLEVAEHVSANASGALVASLVRHGDIVVFSAATPGQGGEHHVNEQPLEYWRDLFTARGYSAFDALRGPLAEAEGVMPWYRFNTLVYANEAGQQRLTGAMLATRLADDARIPRRGDLKWILRKAAAVTLPEAVFHGLLRAKKRVAA